MATLHTQLRLHPGEEHTLKLESLLTAGYEWALEVEGNADVAELTKQDAVGNDELAIGAAPDEVFSIKARRPGRTTIRLVQRRPWEHGGQPANEHVVNVDVAE